MNVIQIMQTFKFFGTIGLIFIIGFASPTEKEYEEDEKLFEDILECSTPIAYNISIKIQNKHLLVDSTVDINVTCTQQFVRLYVGRFCEILTLQVKPAVPHTVPSEWITRSIINSYVAEGRFDSVDVSFIDAYGTDYVARQTLLEQSLTLLDGSKLPPGTYTIYSTHSCLLEKVATVFNISTYITKLENQTENKEFFMGTRFPVEWIFPSYDNSTINAKFTIQIEHKNTEIALSNTIGTTLYETKDMVYTGFNITSISTQLVAVAIVPRSNHVSVKNISEYKSIRSRVQATNSLEYAQTLIQDINRRLNNIWGDLIPQSRNVAYLILPVNVTDHDTVVTKELVIFSEADIIYDVAVDSITKKREVTCLVTRSVIQEVFSDWLATFRESDPWFIEGFSTIYGVFIQDQVYHTTVLKSSLIQTRRKVMDYTEAFIEYDIPIQDPLVISKESILNKLWQERAFSIFYMFSTQFGKELLYTTMFNEAANLYYRPVVTDSTSDDAYNKQSLLDKFWNSKYEVYLRGTWYDQMMTKKVITSWTLNSGYPVVQVLVDNNTRDLDITIKSCFDIDQTKSCSNKWGIFVSLYRVTTTDILSTHQYWLQTLTYSPVSPPILLNENEFVIMDNSTGFRVNYDCQSWRNIALFLKTSKITHPDLSDVTLAQILDDAFYFLVQHRVCNETSETSDVDETSETSDVDIYFDIVSSVLRVDESTIVWFPLLNALEYISESFMFPQKVFTRHIKDRLQTILNKFLDDIDALFDIYSSENIISNQLYHEILKWTCILESSKCNDHVNATLELHFTHPAKTKLLSTWQKWIYCQGLLVGNVSYNIFLGGMWEKLVMMYTSHSKGTELLELLSCSRVKDNILSSIYSLTASLKPPYSTLSEMPPKFFVLPGNVHATKTDIVIFLFNIFAKYSKYNELLSSMLEASQLIGRRVNLNMIAAIICIVNNIYIVSGLAMIIDKEFLRNMTRLYNMPLPIINSIRGKVANRFELLVKKKFNI